MGGGRHTLRASRRVPARRGSWEQRASRESRPDRSRVFLPGQWPPAWDLGWSQPAGQVDLSLRAHSLFFAANTHRVIHSLFSTYMLLP